jgi:hypothetical protein
VVPRIDPTTFGHPGFFTTLSFTHNFVTHHLSHTTLSHATFLTSRSFSTSFVFPSFPVPLQHLLLIIGKNWHVGFSGPLICFFFISWFTYFLWIVEVGPQNSLLAFFFVWHQLDNVSKTMRSHFVKRFIRTSLLIFTPRYMVRSPKVATAQNRCCIQGWCNPYVPFFLPWLILLGFHSNITNPHFSTRQ